FISSGRHREFLQLVGEALGVLWMVCLPITILSLVAASHRAGGYLNWLCCFAALAFFVLAVTSVVSFEEPPKMQLITLTILTAIHYLLLLVFFAFLLFGKVVHLIVGSAPRPNQALEPTASAE